MYSYSFAANLDLFNAFYRMLVPARQGNGVLKFDRILEPSKVGGYNTRHEMRSHHGP